MTFTSNQNLERPLEGQADWDTSLNSNFDILDRGFHGKFVAATGISTGDILWQGSGNILYKYDSRSLDLKAPTAMAYKAVASGETDFFLLRGIVSSIAVWSGKIFPGKPVFVSPSTAGYAVGSYSAAGYPAGLALRNDAIFFAPMQYDVIPEKITVVRSSFLDTTSPQYEQFAIDLGNRGWIRFLEVSSVSSGQVYSLKFYSGSACVNSELLYEVQSGGVTSKYYLDGAGWPYEATDTASPGQIYGQFRYISGTGSSFNYMKIVAERFR